MTKGERCVRHTEILGRKVKWVLIPEREDSGPKQEIQQQTLPTPVKINKSKPPLEWSQGASRERFHTKHRPSWKRRTAQVDANLLPQQEAFFLPSNSPAHERQPQLSQREATTCPGPSSLQGTFSLQQPLPAPPFLSERASSPLFS